MTIIWTVYYKHKIIYCHISKYLKSWMREGGTFKGYHHTAISFKQQENLLN